MKNLSLISLLLCFVISCSKDQKVDPNRYPQKWQLVKMTGQIPNAETTGDDMEWQEYYVLYSDRTFSKYRERDSVSTNASGTFVFNTVSDATYLELHYGSGNDIIGSCTSDYTESLWLKSESELIGTWFYCDGPGLEYARVR